MSDATETVAAYFEGFRRSDHAAILALLTEDVTWYLPGHTTLQGKVAFDAEIENPAFEGSPALTITKMVEQGGTVVAIGQGETRHRESGPVRFAFCDVFEFEGTLIRRVESYVVAL